MRDLFKTIRGIKIYADEPMTRHTTFRIGGKAKCVIKVFSLRALKKVMNIIKKENIKYYILGGGSNILVSDQGFPGIIIKLYGYFRGLKRKDGVFHCGSGLWIDTLLQKAKTCGYGGAEYLAGIPGTIGGAIRGNAGAFGRSMADIVLDIDVLDDQGVVHNIDRRDIGFSYRRTKLTDKDIILFARIALKRGRRREIASRIQKNIAYRGEKQPKEFSAGSYFKNKRPYIAGRLIDACGLKGLKVGGAQVSTKHANFIINTGRAKASDVLRLAILIKKEVKDRKGVLLEEEVKLLK
jgi:UDP-N-acetylmuramate dehydrogenase